MFIRTEDLTHIYMPGTPFAAAALQGVSLNLPRGGFAALIGPSGSGKSTLIQHLNGLLRPTGGRVIVDGRVVGADRGETLRLRRRIGLVFQLPEEQFFAETLFDEVAFAPRNLGLAPGAVAERVREAVEQVGLDYAAFKNRSPFQLSAGQKRLAAIAAVLSLRPEALILDEPAAGLDQAGQQKLFRLLKSLNAGAGLTILVVTHHLEQIAPLVDTILVLNKGRLVMSGSPAQVFSRGEELRGLGLALPPVSEIMHGLARTGCPVNPAVFSLEEARREITFWRREACGP
jgi:energy-coupling factor transport system ATP-binding protein